jgi:hypothetical protein
MISGSFVPLFGNMKKMLLQMTSGFLQLESTIHTYLLIISTLYSYFLMKSGFIFDVKQPY